MLALGQNIHKEPEVLQTNTCLSTKMYVFKTGITMHLVRHSELFKDHLCEFSLNGRTYRGLKKAGNQNLTRLLAHTMKAVSLSFRQTKFDKLKVDFGIIGKKLKTLPIFIVHTHYSAIKRIFTYGLNSERHGW